MLNINDALKAIGLGLLVLFFAVGVVKTCSSVADLKRPEHALRLFVRFALAKGVITYGMDLMLALLDIVQGVISTIMQDDEYKELRDALELNRDSKVLMFSTEGDTDPDKYKKIVWGGEYPTV